MLRRVATLAAWLVHLYTASSAVVGLWALKASAEHDFRLAMGLMLLCLVIDATDGTLARALAVRERIPGVDGRRLDDICDYLTYVVVPAFFLVQAGLLPHPAWAAAPLVSSAYGFSRVGAKTDDHFFLGWPSYWNVLAIYLYLLSAPPNLVLALVLALAGGVFIPLRYIYPSRTRAWRPLTLVVLALWLGVLAGLVLRPDPNPRSVALTLIGPAYYLAASVLLGLRRRKPGPAVPSDA